MPKKSTRKRKQQAQDFAKQKLKLGTKSSQKNIEITSKRVCVPAQSITPSQSLSSTLVNCTHYAPSTRVSALSMLKTYPTAEIIGSLSQVIHVTAKTMLDTEARCRKALAEFYNTSEIPSQSYKPFIPLLMSYTCSALTHVSPEIRFDGKCRVMQGKSL